MVDSDKAAALYLAQVEAQLRKHNTGANQLKKQPNPAVAARLATAAQSAGLRAAGVELTNIMRERAEKGLTNDGGSADKVSDAYATWRENKFGVPKSEVYKATGQLLAELNTSGLRLTKA